MGLTENVPDLSITILFPAGRFLSPPGRGRGSPFGCKIPPPDPGKHIVPAAEGLVWRELYEGVS